MASNRSKPPNDDNGLLDLLVQFLSGDFDTPVFRPPQTGLDPEPHPAPPIAPPSEPEDAVEARPLHSRRPSATDRIRNVLDLQRDKNATSPPSAWESPAISSSGQESLANGPPMVPPTNEAPATPTELTLIQRIKVLVESLPPFPPPQFKVTALSDNLDKTHEEHSRRDAAAISNPATAPFSNADTNTDTVNVLTVDPPEPMPFAKRIKLLIDALPSLPAPKSQTVSLPDARSRRIAQEAIPIRDSELVALLSSAPVMNGNTGNERQSVWSALDYLRPPRRNATTGKGIGAREEQQEDYDDDISDTSSVMMYSPLMPKRDSIVEIADSESVFESVFEEESAVPEIPATQNGLLPRVSRWVRKGKGREEEITPSALVSDPTMGQAAPAVKAPKMKEHKIWLPSGTKISVQAIWWGYRIYLPPPVLATLSDTEIEMTQRAAMLTSALQWLLGHLPVAALPPPLQPILLLLQRLSPIIAYLGTFVAWSWGAIKSYDKGYGVVLTATWLLPIALIPSTWEASVGISSPPSSVPPPLPSASQSTLIQPPSVTNAGAESSSTRQVVENASGTDVSLRGVKGVGNTRTAIDTPSGSRPSSSRVAAVPSWRRIARAASSADASPRSSNGGKEISRVPTISRSATSGPTTEHSARRMARAASSADAYARRDTGRTMVPVHASVASGPSSNGVHAEHALRQVARAVSSTGGTKNPRDTPSTSSALPTPVFPARPELRPTRATRSETAPGTAKRKTALRDPSTRSEPLLHFDDEAERAARSARRAAACADLLSRSALLKQGKLREPRNTKESSRHRVVAGDAHSRPEARLAGSKDVPPQEVMKRDSSRQK